MIKHNTSDDTRTHSSVENTYTSPEQEKLLKILKINGETILTCISLKHNTNLSSRILTSRLL